VAGQFDRSHTLRGEIVVDPFEKENGYGSLFGHRVWRVGEDGWLTGHYFAAKWLPGENAARCLQVTGAATGVPFFPYFMPGNRSAYDFSGEEPVLLPGFVPKDCPGVATGDHGCGFYVRTSERFRDGGAWPIVRGVCEAWGQVELGDKGFRASKARITALLKPTLDDETREDVATRANDIKFLKREISKLAQSLYGRADIDQMESLERRLETARKINERKTRPIRTWPLIVKRYPDAHVFDDEDSMLAWWPPTDLSRLLEEK
jgi:hypothetical protein